MYQRFNDGRPPAGGYNRGGRGGDYGTGYNGGYGGGHGNRPGGTGGGEGQRPLANYIISPPDKTLIWIIGTLIVIGIMAIFSAGSPRAVAEGVNPVFFTVRQLAWLVAGVFGAMFFANFDYRKLRAYTYQLPVVVLILLLLVQFTPLGLTVMRLKGGLCLGLSSFNLQSLQSLQ